MPIISAVRAKEYEKQEWGEREAVHRVCLDALLQGLNRTTLSKPFTQTGAGSYGQPPQSPACLRFSFLRAHLPQPGALNAARARSARATATHSHSQTEPRLFLDGFRIKGIAGLEREPRTVFHNLHPASFSRQTHQGLRVRLYDSVAGRCASRRGHYATTARAFFAISTFTLRREHLAPVEHWSCLYRFSFVAPVDRAGSVSYPTPSTPPAPPPRPPILPPNSRPKLHPAPARSQAGRFAAGPCSSASCNSLGRRFPRPESALICAKSARAAATFSVCLVLLSKVEESGPPTHG